MIRNTAQLATDVLINEGLNVIVGYSGSGKTEFCNFLQRIAKENGHKTINLEDVGPTISEQMYSQIDHLSNSYDVLFLNNYFLQIPNNYELVKERIFKLREICQRKNITIFLTVPAINYIRVDNLSSFAAEKMSNGVLFMRTADNIISINKMPQKELPWLLKFLKWIFKFDVPNSAINFIKTRFIDKETKLYLYFDSKEKKYYDIDRRNPFLRLFYDF